MCTSPIYMNIRRRCFANGDYSKVLPNIPVPCGQCAECLRKRQSSLVVRVDRESKEYPLAYFVTLTYNEATCPVSRSLCRVDKSSGELSFDSLPAIIDRKSDNEQYLFARGQLNELPLDSNSPRHFFYDLGETSEALFKVCYSDSVCPSDVQKLFKRFRRWYDYRYHTNLDFRYTICSEYGEHTNRPHYHCLLLFKDNIDNVYPLASVFASLWNFGHVKVDKVSFGTVANVSRYVSKYMYKPRKNHIGFSYCLPCRVRSSISFGSRLSPEQLGYYRCYDAFGHYSIFNIDKTFNYEQKQTLFERIFKRLSYSLDSFTYSLPCAVKRRIFGFSLQSGNFVWSPLYSQFIAFVKDRVLQRNREEYELFCQNNAFEVDTFESFIAFENYQQIVNSIRETNSQKKVGKALAKSRF